MWTEILAIYAAVISTISLAIAYLAHRSGDPQLSGAAEIVGRYDIAGPTLHIALHNRGRGPITVDSIMLWGLTPSWGGKTLPIVGWPLHAPNSQLPARIEGHSGRNWHTPAQEIAKEALSRSDLVRLELIVYLAEGKTLTLTVGTSDIDELDPDNLPDWEPEPEGPAKPWQIESDAKP
jgi:hypothetical protein